MPSSYDRDHRKPRRLRHRKGKKIHDQTALLTGNSKKRAKRPPTLEAITKKQKKPESATGKKAGCDSQKASRKKEQLMAKKREKGRVHQPRTEGRKRNHLGDTRHDRYPDTTTCERQKKRTPRPTRSKTKNRRFPHRILNATLYQKRQKIQPWNQPAGTSPAQTAKRKKP